MSLKSFTVRTGLKIVSTSGSGATIFAGNSTDLSNLAVLAGESSLGSLFLRSDGVVLKKETDTNQVSDWVELGEAEAIATLESRVDSIDALIGVISSGNYTAGNTIGEDISLLDTQVKVNADYIEDLQDLVNVTSTSIAASNTGVINTINKTTSSMMKWEVIGVDDSDSSLVRAVEVTALQNGTVSNFDVANILDTGLPFYTVSADINGSNVELSATSPASNDVTYKVRRISASGLAISELSSSFNSYTIATLPTGVSNGTQAYVTDGGYLAYYKDGSWYKVSDDTLVA